MEAIYTKTTATGKHVEFFATRYLDSALLNVHVDGKSFDTCARIHEITAQTRKMYNNKLSPEATHMAGKVCLLASDAAVLIPLVAAHQAEIDAEPRVQLSKLMEKRRGIQAEIRGWMDEESGLVNGAFESGDSINPFGGPRIAEAKAGAKTACGKLEKFDAEHPEVLAEIKRLDEESLERNRWN